MNIFSDSNEDDDSTESHPIYDNPSYYVIDPEDGLRSNLPSWVENIISERKSLADTLRKLRLIPSLFIGWPDEEDNSELRDFVLNLGFSIDTQFIDRGPGSSNDSLIYIKKSKIPKVKEREAKILRSVQRNAIKAAKAKLKKDLSTGEIKDEHLNDEIEKLVAILNSQDAVWREKAEKIDELEEEIKELNEHISDRDKNIEFLMEKLQKTEKKLESAGIKSAGEMTRTEKWMQKVRDQADLYCAWAAALEAEFSIVIKGPVLYLPDGKVFVIKQAYRRQLSEQEHGADVVESIKKSVPFAEWISFNPNHRLGMTSTGEPNWERANWFLAGRVAWSQIWWVACAYICGKLPAFAEVNGVRLKIELLGISPERQNKFQELFEKYWGKGIHWDEKFERE